VGSPKSAANSFYEVVSFTHHASRPGFRIAELTIRPSSLELRGVSVSLGTRRREWAAFPKARRAFVPELQRALGTTRPFS